MTIYTASKVLLPTGIDELGARHGLVRLFNETLSDYRKRLYLEINEPADVSFKNLKSLPSRRLGLRDLPVYRITLALDGNDRPLAEDPVIAITATKIFAWADKSGDLLDFELDFTSDGYFLRDVKTAFDASTYFVLEELPYLSDYDFFLSMNLRVGDNIKTAIVEDLGSNNSYIFRSGNVRDVRFTNQTSFSFLKNDVSLVEEEGDYFLDKVTGLLVSHSPCYGSAVFEYAEFPFDLYWQPVRTMELKDEDMNSLLYENLADADSSVYSPQRLTSYGAKVYNELLKVSNSSWGE